MTISPDLTLADLVSADPGRAHLLDQLGLNYCCGGQHTLREACQAAGLDEAQVLAALDAGPCANPAVDWDEVSLEALGDLIVDTHQPYLWRELPRLQVLMGKVVRVHGEEHPELHELREVFDVLRATLEPHLRTEARVLFPAIAAREAGMPPDATPDGPAAADIAALLEEHRGVGDGLARLREISDGYTPPPDACLSYRALMSGLDDLEHAIHVQVHLENTELFPRAQSLGID